MPSKHKRTSEHREPERAESNLSDSEMIDVQAIVQQSETRQPSTSEYAAQNIQSAIRSFGSIAGSAGQAIQSGSGTVANAVFTVVTSPKEAADIAYYNATSTAYHKRGGEFSRYFKAHTDKNEVTNWLNNNDPDNEHGEKYYYRYSTRMGKVTKRDSNNSQYVEAVGDNVIKYAMSNVKQQEQSQERTGVIR